MQLLTARGAAPSRGKGVSLSLCAHPMAPYKFSHASGTLGHLGTFQGHQKEVFKADVFLKRWHEDWHFLQV